MKPSTSEENTLADDLSRLNDGAEIPAVLTKVIRTAPVMDKWVIVGNTPTPPRRPRGDGAGQR